MPCANGIAIVIVAAVLAAAIFIFIVVPWGDCKTHRSVIGGELLAPGWGYAVREADVVLTGKVAQKLGSQPDLLLFRDAGEEPKVVVTDYRIDVGQFWHPLTASDPAVAVSVLEPNPEYGAGGEFVILMHGADLAIGQRVLLFLRRIPPEAEAAGELGLGYPLPDGFSYRNHYSIMGVVRYGLHCG